MNSLFCRVNEFIEKIICQKSSSLYMQKYRKMLAFINICKDWLFHLNFKRRLRVMLWKIILFLGCTYSHTVMRNSVKDGNVHVYSKENSIVRPKSVFLLFHYLLEHISACKEGAEVTGAEMVDPRGYRALWSNRRSEHDPRDTRKYSFTHALSVFDIKVLHVFRVPIRCLGFNPVCQAIFSYTPRTLSYLFCDKNVCTVNLEQLMKIFMCVNFLLFLQLWGKKSLQYIVLDCLLWHFYI